MGRAGSANPAHIQPRRLLETYRRLTPFNEIIAQPDAVFLNGEYAQEIRNYIGHGHSQAFEYNIIEHLPSGMPLEVFRDQQGINLFYVEETFSTRFPADPFDPAFIGSLKTAGW